MLTPLDIENKKFSKQMMNGYSVEEVDDFLDQITADYEKIYKDNAEMKKKVDELEKNLVHYKTIESTLQNTLVMAQSTAEEVKDIARQQAEQIVKEAEDTASQVKGRGRFVKEHDFGLHRQSPSNRHPLLLAPRKGLRIGVSFVSQPDFFQQLVGMSFDGLRVVNL